MALDPAVFDKEKPQGFYLLGDTEEMESLSDATFIVEGARLPVRLRSGLAPCLLLSAGHRRPSIIISNSALTESLLHLMQVHTQVLSIQSRVLRGLFADMKGGHESSDGSKVVAEQVG